MFGACVLIEALLHHETRLLDAVWVLAIAIAVSIAIAISVAVAISMVIGVVRALAVAFASHLPHMAGDQLAFEYMALEFDDVAGIYLVDAAQAFGVDINIRTRAVFQKTITFTDVEPFDCRLHTDTTENE